MKKISIRFIIPLTIICIIGSIFYISTIPSVQQTWALATTVQPETFTELYFEDHTNLPKTIEKYKEFNFTFTIHNAEYKDVKYPYEVYLQRDNQKIILDQGKINLKDNEFKSIKENFGPLKNLRAKIVVELTSKNQQIDFWMDAGGK